MKPALRFSLLALLAGSHGVNDFLAGWMLGGDLPSASAWDRLPWLAIYAALAFAGQMPVAWLLERSRREDRWLGGSLVLMVAAVGAWRISPGLAIVVSGIASAFCHVAGGALALRLPRGERALGWFAAPGVLGLALGGWLGHSGGSLAPWAVLLPVLLLAGWVMLRGCWAKLGADRDAAPTGDDPAASPEGRAGGPGLEAHDGVMLLILLAITLRSALWDLVQMTQWPDPSVLFALALSAGLGKVIGGWMASRWPTVRQVSITLVVSCLLLEFARQSVAGLCAGVALLQSTIPSSIVILHRSFGTSAARATAYGLGLTVALGGLVIPLRLDFPVILAAAVLAAVAVALWDGARRKGNEPAPATANHE